MSAAVDRKYYEAVRPGGVAERLLVRARAAIFADFTARMRPARDDTILDVGVSDVINRGANVLEREYPYQDRITACGLGEAGAFRRAFPRCGYVRIAANARLPFDDLSFDIATSNAVLEHVGSRDNQVSFIQELCRVARRAFVVVPNRCFPIEHHTALPLVHYERNLFRLACSITGRGVWTEESNLILMTRRRLRELAGTVGRSGTVGYTGLRLGPLSSNLYLSLD